MFPRNFPVDAEAADLLVCQQVRNKLATSRCNGIWETTRQNRHNGHLPAPTCYSLVIYVADLLWGNWYNGFWPIMVNPAVIVHLLFMLLAVSCHWGHVVCFLCVQPASNWLCISGVLLYLYNDIMSRWSRQQSMAWIFLVIGLTGYIGPIVC